MEKIIRQVLTGNVLLIVCSIFYLSWWLLAFKPTGAVKGMKSGWLLLPAMVFGLAGLVLIVRGVQAAQLRQTIIPAGRILPVSVCAYLILMAGTWLFLKRPVTTELLLIVMWAAVTAAEINMLYGMEVFTFGSACGFLSVTMLFALISMAAYILYYDLDAVRGYVDGMIPLLLAALMMGAISVRIVM